MPDVHPISERERIRRVERDRGSIIALGTLWAIDKDTVVYDHVVDALGPDDLIDQARKDGNMRWSGLSDYIRRHKSDV